MTIRSIGIVFWIPKANQNISTFCFSTVTMATRTRFNVNVMRTVPVFVEH